MDQHVALRELFQDLPPRNDAPDRQAFGHTKPLREFPQSRSLGAVPNQPILTFRELPVELSERPHAQVITLPVQKSTDAD
jgi:hypothetical protein